MMKNSLILLVSMFLFVSACSDDDDKGLIGADLNDAVFRIIPTDYETFVMKLEPYSVVDAKLILKKYDKTLATKEFEYGRWWYEAEVNYTFKKGEEYDIELIVDYDYDGEIVEQRTKVRNYEHKYIKFISSGQIVESMDILDYDLSPSRKVLFYCERANGNTVINRLDLSTNEVTKIWEGKKWPDYRSIGDNNLLVSSTYYKKRLLGRDSAALYNFDVIKGDSVFYGWADREYSFTRVVDHRLFVAHPAYSTQVCYDIRDGSSKEYREPFKNMETSSFDHHYYGNKIFDTSENKFVEHLPFLNDEQSIRYYDEETQTYIVEERYQGQENRGQARILVYRDERVIFENEFEYKVYLSFPKLMKIRDDKFIVYKSYREHSAPRIDGYYQIDLKYGTETLINTDYGNADDRYEFFIYDDPDAFLSIREDGIYKMKNFF